MRCERCSGDGYIGISANSPDQKCQGCSGRGFIVSDHWDEMALQDIEDAESEAGEIAANIVKTKGRAPKNLAEGQRWLIECTDIDGSDQMMDNIVETMLALREPPKRYHPYDDDPKFGSW